MFRLFNLGSISNRERRKDRRKGRKDHFINGSDENVDIGFENVFLHMKVHLIEVFFLEEFSLQAGFFYWRVFRIMFPY